MAFAGDLEGEGTVEWLMGYGDDGTAAFVGLERVVGKVGDRSGSFVLQHTGTFDGQIAKATSASCPAPAPASSPGSRARARSRPAWAPTASAASSSTTTSRAALGLGTAVGLGAVRHRGRSHARRAPVPRRCIPGESGDRGRLSQVGHFARRPQRVYEHAIFRPKGVHAQAHTAAGSSSCPASSRSSPPASASPATSDAAPKTKKLHGPHGGHPQHAHRRHPAPLRPRRPSCPSATGVCSSFDAKGDIKGDGLVSIDTFPPPAARRPAYSEAHTVIHDQEGRPDLHGGGALRPDQAPITRFVDECIITGGTGIYAGATGYIQEVGTFDFAANLGELEYFGKITYADDARPGTLTTTDDASGRGSGARARGGRRAPRRRARRRTRQRLAHEVGDRRRRRSRAA